MNSELWMVLGVGLVAITVLAFVGALIAQAVIPGAAGLGAIGAPAAAGAALFGPVGAVVAGLVGGFVWVLFGGGAAADEVVVYFEPGLRPSYTPPPRAAPPPEPPRQPPPGAPPPGARLDPMIIGILDEAGRTGDTDGVCRRNGVTPEQFNAWLDAYLAARRIDPTAGDEYR